jgi:hypothetical protein|tara:strand:- start:541 stop:1344 length:804 start_codon:yes stop_codon:yes gene_type:complete
MLTKPEIENIISEDLKKILSNKTIYKYSDFNTGIDKILLGRTLNFSHPNVFNDPFDCNEKLLKVIIPKEELKRLFELGKSNIPIDLHEQFWKNINDPKMVDKFNRSEKDRYLISCFSELNNEVLMWSHYGEKHNGVCIGFDFPHAYEDKFIICPIKYEAELKPLDGECSLARVILYWLTTKSNRWSYEKEIRAITRATEKTKSEILEYDGKYIKEVVFGCNVDKEKINETLILIRNSSLNIDKIEFKKMEIDNDTFLLKESLIKPSA